MTPQGPVQRLRAACSGLEQRGRPRAEGWALPGTLHGRGCGEAAEGKGKVWASQQPQAIPPSGCQRVPKVTCSFMTSPQAGAPTRPVPTFLALRSSEPTLRGFS